VAAAGDGAPARAGKRARSPRRAAAVVGAVVALAAAVTLVLSLRSPREPVADGSGSGRVIVAPDPSRVLDGGTSIGGQVPVDPRPDDRQAPVENERAEDNRPVDKPVGKKSQVPPKTKTPIKPPNRSSAVKPTADPAGTLSAAQIDRVMRGAAAAVRACSPEAPVALHVAVAPSGQVSEVRVVSGIAGKLAKQRVAEPDAACVAAALSSLRFPPWDGEPHSFDYRYPLAD
jgi:hypothetical protein